MNLLGPSASNAPAYREGFPLSGLHPDILRPSPILQQAAYAASFRHSIELTRKRKPYRITFALDLFNGPDTRLASRKVLGILLRALVDINRIFLQENPGTPLIYNSGIRYVEEPPGNEDWQDIPTTVKLMYADCEDVACWRTAELNERFGIAAVPAFKEQARPDGSYLYHIVVMYPDRRIEDPSAILGMR